MPRTKRGKAVSAGVAAKVTEAMLGTVDQFNPEWVEDKIEQDCAIVRALNWYNQMATPKLEKEWTVEYLRNEGADKETLKIVRGADTNSFVRVGRFANMLTLGYPVDESRVLDPVDELKEAFKAQKKAKAKTKKKSTGPSVQDRMNEKAAELACELQQVVDEFIDGVHDRPKGQDKDFFDPESWISKNQIKPLIANRVIPHIQEDRKEFSAALANRKELQEEYDLFRETHLKRIEAFIRTIEDALKMKGKQKRVVRRKRKQKSPIDLTKNVKYLSETKEYGGVKSVLPSKIVGASKVVILNTKTRQFMIYESVDGSGLTVKGTTIQNFDVKKSVMKRVREQYLDSLVKTTTTKGIRAIKSEYKGINAKEDVPSGRINQDCVILNSL
jgi:hypothetical protein